MTDMDEPDRSPMPPQEADDQPPPSPQRGQRSSAIELDFVDASATLTHAELDTLNTLAHRVLSQLSNSGSVRARIVNDEAMIDAHQRYCDLSTTTDVLTFDMASDDTDFESKVIDTDLILCVDEARRQAQQRQHTTVHELLLYTLHGVLHCLGHDDHSDQEYKRMHAREDELLTSAGIGALFSEQPAAARPGQQENRS